MLNIVIPTPIPPLFSETDSHSAQAELPSLTGLPQPFQGFGFSYWAILTLVWVSFRGDVTNPGFLLTDIIGSGCLSLNSLLG